MLSLRTDKGLSFEKYKELFNSPLPQGIILEAEKLKKLNLLNINDNGISLTEKGFLLSNSIIAELLSRGI